MAHITVSVEYAIHCLLWLAGAEGRDTAASSRDLAELQGVSPSFLAKILPRLERAGLVVGQDGVRGGYRLARPPAAISFLDVVDAIEGDKPLFDCQEIRGRCAVFEGEPPAWATRGTCGVHAVMRQAEKAMREVLRSQTLADVGARFERQAPVQFFSQVDAWLDARQGRRGRPPREPTS